MPLGVLPVAILRLEGVLAVAAGVATAIVGVAAVVAGVVAGAARETTPASSRRRSTVLVVFAQRVLALRRQLTIPRRTCLRAGSVRRRRRRRGRRVVLVQDSVKAYGSVAARDVVYHCGEDCARR